MEVVILVICFISGSLWYLLHLIDVYGDHFCFIDDSEIKCYIFQIVVYIKFWRYIERTHFLSNKVGPVENRHEKG